MKKPVDFEMRDQQCKMLADFKTLGLIEIWMGEL